MKKLLFTVLAVLLLFLADAANAQMDRVRADVEDQEAFWTPALVTQATTHQLPANNLNVTIMHSFGIATEDVIRNFFGLDNVQNVRLGLDFGITDRWSAGIGRSSLLNVVDLRTKYALMRQNSGDSRPVNLSLQGDLGITTQENRRPIEDDISGLISAVVSRKVSEKLSVQLSPMYGYYSRPSQGEVNNIFAIGLGSELKLSTRFALLAEYYPVLSSRNDNTNNAFSLGLSIQTGGHVFQLFFTSTEWHLEQYVLANNDRQFWAGDFRFGFNVNRIFGISL